MSSMKNQTETEKKRSVSGKALKSGVWYTLCNFLLKSLGFITTPIFARLLTKEEYGNFTNYQSWLSIVAIVVTLEMSSCVIRGKFDFEEDFDGFVSAVVFCGVSITAVAYGAVLLFPRFFEMIFDMEMPYIHLMFLNCLVAPAFSILQAKHRILQKYIEVVILSLSSAVISTLASVYCVMNFKDKLFGRVFGMTAPLIVIYLIIFIMIMVRGKCFYRKEYWKYAIVFSLPLVPHLLSNTLLNSADRIMIKKICGPEDAALYGLAYSAGAVIATLFTAMNSAWEPWLFDRVNEGDYETVKKTSRYYLIFFVLLVLGAILIAPELVLIMGGRSYAEAVFVIPPVMIGYGCKFVYTFYVNMEKFAKRTSFISIGTLIAAGLNILLNLIFIPIIGYQAAAYTTLVGFLLLAFLHYFMAKRMDIIGMYDNRFLFLVLFVMIAAGLLFQALYLVSLWVRWGCILAMGAAGLLYSLKMAKKYNLFEKYLKKK